MRSDPKQRTRDGHWRRSMRRLFLHPDVVQTVQHLALLLKSGAQIDFSQNAWYMEYQEGAITYSSYRNLLHLV